MCCPTLRQKVGKQKHLVDSFHDFHRKGSEVEGAMCHEQQCWEAGVYHLGRPLCRWLKSCPRKRIRMALDGITARGDTSGWKLQAEMCREKKN